MKTTLSKNAKIKLALGIAIPVLVMIVTVSMLGVSFAWFSNENEVYIESISITTEAAYSVAFDTKSAGDNLLYRGQTAMENGGKIIYNPSSARKDDRPFCFASLINLNTHGQEAEIAISFDYANIFEELGSGDSKTKQSINLYSSTDGNSIDLIPYVFTWFFKAHTAGENVMATNKLNPSAAPDDQEMMYYTPQANEIWYTPYGALTFDANGKVSAINGTATTAMPSDTQGFTLQTTDEGVLYDFYIVFAPEALFWAQFFTGMENATAQSVYVDENGDIDHDIINHIAGNSIGSTSGVCNSVYYSGYRYLGTQFEFTAVIDVLKLVETTE